MTTSLILSVLSVFLMMVPGYILSKKNILTESFLKQLTKLIVTFIYPCLAFSSVLKNFSLDLLLDNWQLPVASSLITIIGYFSGRFFLFFHTIAKKEERSSFLYCNSFNNYIFLPLAIVVQIFEPKYAAAVIISSIGTEFLVWTLGVYIMQPHAKVWSKESLKHLLSPPLLALYTAIGVLIIFHFVGSSLNVLFLDFPITKYVFNSIDTMGAATIPLTLTLAGARIAQTNIQLLSISNIWYSTALRLIVTPLIAMTALKYIFPENDFLQVLFVIAMTPVAFNSLVLGELFNADMKTISGTILLSYMLSLITIPIWILIMF